MEHLPAGSFYRPSAFIGLAHRPSALLLRIARRDIPDAKRRALKSTPFRQKRESVVPRLLAGM
ncbi:hypothetical protein NFC73_06935 [Pseudarthrobacter sp. RMG13]|uniref:Uncharacterized protein n=1 Tax=Pseudarthrobacter humi TaxID=2952523 RepID=A0ABT1LLY1_9MICC|nr:hypothetical protein [Pseudarthrobacter humi]MCP8999467.1 hypothetical protein [Pseudarthrobacter humi]